MLPIKNRLGIGEFVCVVSSWVNLPLLLLLYFKHSPGLQGSDTDELVDSLHLPSYRSSQLLLVDVGAVTPENSKQIQIQQTNKNSSEWIHQTAVSKTPFLLLFKQTPSRSRRIISYHAIRNVNVHCDERVPHETCIRSDNIAGDHQILSVWGRTR